MNLANRKYPDEKARNLTQGRFDEVWEVDISEAGDIVFTNDMTGEIPDVRYGIYLIPSHQIEKPLPKATLIREVSANRVV